MADTSYNKLLDPVSDIITSMESIMVGAFGNTMGDQRESYKRIHTQTWGIHTLMMDIITSLGIDNVATHPQVNDRFHSLLRPIKTNIDDLTSGYDGALNEEQALIMEFVETAIDSIEHMMNNLWQFSLIKHDMIEYSTTTFNFNRLVSYVSEQLSDYVVPELSLPVQVVGDQEHLLYAIGEIAYNIKQHAYVEKVSLETQITANHITLRVIDHGYGFVYNEMDDIYQPFWQSDASNEGLGLGLYIAQTFVKQSNGTITVSSQHQGGTTVEITLPLAK